MTKKKWRWTHTLVVALGSQKDLLFCLFNFWKLRIHACLLLEFAILTTNKLQGNFVDTHLFNSVALRQAKTPWSFGHSECNWVKEEMRAWLSQLVYYFILLNLSDLSLKYFIKYFRKMNHRKKKKKRRVRTLEREKERGKGKEREKEKGRGREKLEVRNQGRKVKLKTKAFLVSK